MKNARSLAGSFAILAALVLAISAYGQGTSGTGIPEPITTSELMRFADRLGLSGDQRLALQPFHDEYREQFRLLREGDITRYLDEMQRTGAMMPGRDGWEEARKQRERILSRIRGLDDSLFASIEPILTDAQRENLPRMRMARQRARAIPASQIMMGRIDVVDLSELVFEADLSLAERERIDNVLAQYEDRLTRMVEQLPDLVANGWVEYHRRMDELMAEISRDPDRFEERQHEMMTSMQESFLPPHTHAIDIRALGRQTLFAITAELSDTTALALREAFLRRAYMNASNHLRSRTQFTIESMMRSEMFEDHHDRLAEIITELRTQTDPIVREALQVVDGFERETFTFAADQEAMSKHNERLRGFGRQIQQVDEALQAKLSEMSPNMRAAGRGGAAPPHGVQIAPPQARVEVRDGGVAVTVGPWHEQFVVPPISAREMRDHAGALGVGEHDETMRELHRAYRERIKESAGPLSREAMRFPEVEHGAHVEHAERVIEARRGAFDAIVAEDDRYFNELLAALPDEAERIEGMRSNREGRRYAAGHSVPMMGWGMPSVAASLDLSHIAREERIDLDASPEAKRILAEYERGLTPLLREHYERAVEHADAVMLSHARQMDSLPREGGTVIIRAGDERMEEMRRQQEMHRLAERAARAVSDLHQETIAELSAALPQEQADALLAAYHRLAFPQVYNDSGAMEQTLTHALQMDDLTQAQREQITEVLAEYRPAYRDLTERLREVTEEQEHAHRQFHEAMERGERPQATDRRLHEEIMTLRHDRQELNARTIVRLRTLLSEEQLNRLGPMPDPDPHARFRRMMGH